MEKFVAFNLYGRNEHGACVTRVLPDGEQKEVYLASDVEAAFKKLSDARLDWGMACDCECKGCDALDAALRDLMET